MYLDAAYVAKFYLNEPDSPAVRTLMESATCLAISAWSIVEVSSVFHRYYRQGQLSKAQYQDLSRVFLANIDEEVWTVVPVTDALLRRVSSLMATIPPDVFLRAGDAVQLVSALEAGEPEVWTNDRHMLAAAPHLGITGRTA